MRKLITVLLCIGVVVTWQLYQNDSAIAWDKQKKGKRCSIAGLWDVKYPGDVDAGSIDIYTPLDPFGKKFVASVQNLNPDDPTHDGYFPEDTVGGDTFGYATRISRSEYDISFYTYGISKSEGGPVWKSEIRGTTKFLDDCDKRLEENELRFYISVEVDGGAVWYDIGECISFTAVAERITHAEPCE